MLPLMTILLLAITQRNQATTSWMIQNVSFNEDKIHKMWLPHDGETLKQYPHPLHMSFNNFPSIHNNVNISSGEPVAFGFRVERTFEELDRRLLLQLSSKVGEPFVLFGEYTSQIRSVRLSSDMECSKLKENISQVVPVRILKAFSNCILQCETLPINEVVERPLQVCVEPPSDRRVAHLPFTQILFEETESHILPLYIEIPIIVACAMLSCIFSGLTTGLMALSTDDLVLISEGSEDVNERQYATNILPLRENGNFLLCSIVFGNTFTNCITTLLINDLSKNVNPEIAQLISEGSEDVNERQYATNILPLRENGNFLLCSIVFGNTFTNCITTLLINDLSKNVNPEIAQLLVALIIPTLIITIFGEIVPQAVCSNHGLVIGSRTRYLTIFFMVLFCPISYPISRFLDVVVGVEGRDVYDRKTLRVLITTQRDLIKDTAKKHMAERKMMDVETTDLVLAAIDFPEKIVMSVMTPIDKIFMLSDGSVIDNALLKTIAAKGRTRIPIYKGKDRETIVGVLNMKDLLPFCQSSKLKVGTVAQLWQRSSRFRFALGGTRVMQLMIEMKNGVRIAMVVKFDDRRRDYVVMGLLTLEDVVEEVVGEIMDEKDAKMSKQSRISQWKKTMIADL
ncbi:Metal transporter CNNM2 [Toxocara canis]|uniref:Metal transporter CNNM2 n=1 Tax=Toxocara canis TaxID=6265 RepID=A0A0B2V359_TOXCA|nr:Metal transporter CNNM2 [Toxocara canis]